MYSASGLGNKDELVNRYAPLVKRLAYHLLGRLPASIQADDLIQAGLIGLLDAAAHYDERQGAAFETYATIRIRGAMLDEVRRQDWVPKSVHRKARQIAEAIHAVEAEKLGDASDQEVAAKLGVPLDEYYAMLQEASTGKWLSLDELNAEDSPFIDQFAADTPQPFEEIREEAFQKRLAEAIGLLPERERLVVALYYERGLNLKEIGAILDVGESRVSQLLGQSHARLRARLRDWIE
jgi:RNA polymerase sigma factor for flagellar operon FliA